MLKEALIKQLQEKYGITILNDYDLENNRYWYVDIMNHPHTDPDGNPIRFDSFDDALEYATTELVDISE